MTKNDLIAGLKGKPVEFATPSGAKVFLRPLDGTARIALDKWQNDHKDDPGVNLAFTLQIAAAVLTDESGDVSLSAEDVGSLPVLDVDALSKEAMKRAGMVDDSGKASPATTPN